MQAPRSATNDGISRCTAHALGGYRLRLVSENVQVAQSAGQSRNPDSTRSTPNSQTNHRLALTPKHQTTLRYRLRMILATGTSTNDEVLIPAMIVDPVWP